MAPPDSYLQVGIDNYKQPVILWTTLFLILIAVPVKSANSAASFDIKTSVE